MTFSFTGWEVDWTTYTSLPRMLSLTCESRGDASVVHHRMGWHHRQVTCTLISPSAKRWSCTFESAVRIS